MDRIARAGADAIEIHIAHGYILGVFLNRRDTQRTDAYGGSLANRARLRCEVVAAVKARLGAVRAVRLASVHLPLRRARAGREGVGRGGGDWPRDRVDPSHVGCGPAAWALKVRAPLALRTRLCSFQR
ncbi:hypothetical protein [Rhodococcus sp. IEGM 1408]|uniref:oxidoreductase n=1 Tax=Rhodococcus sp. IEGM 1408 TaxID=3082220 RepID=UPI0029558AAF|nr:hypothetical protein [Rhodococcus sp. IEGM 1408]MDV8002799.1 hypothetical protein [Rhodococcus sp. IEGM 1408]